MSQRAYLDVANHFFHDAVDLCVRFQHCYYGDVVGFQTIKSRRTKAFIDLRIAFESILKGYGAYYLYEGEPTEVIVKAVEKYRHHVDRLFEDVKERLPEGTLEACGTFASDVAELPVGLRYRMDAWDFEANREDLY